MENQENILDLYYNKHLKQKDIATIIGVSKQYVSKVVRQDVRYAKERETRKLNNKEKQKKRKAFLKAKGKVKLNRHKKVPDERLVY